MKGNSPLRGLLLQVPPGNVVAVPKYSPVAHPGGLLPGLLLPSAPMMLASSCGSSLLRTVRGSSMGFRGRFEARVRLYTSALPVVAAVCARAA